MNVRIVETERHFLRKSIYPETRVLDSKQVVVKNVVIRNAKIMLNAIVLRNGVGYRWAFS
tara:strand:+ start:696 stop:875 length:180 start_codon:yes stop_codon:yes gene_type:complete